MRQFRVRHFQSDTHGPHLKYTNVPKEAKTGRSYHDDDALLANIIEIAREKGRASSKKSSVFRMTLGPTNNMAAKEFSLEGAVTVFDYSTPGLFVFLNHGCGNPRDKRL